MPKKEKSLGGYFVKMENTAYKTDFHVSISKDSGEVVWQENLTSRVEAEKAYNAAVQLLRRI